jgi:hypothetical protein
MMVVRTGQGGEVVNGRLKPANAGPSSDLAGASPDQGRDDTAAAAAGSTKRSAFSFGAKSRAGASSKDAAETIKAGKTTPKASTC